MYSLLFMTVTGIIGSDGELWKQHRRFALEVLRDFGMGKSLLEDKIHEEALFFMEEIASFEERPMNPHRLIMYAVSNIIGSMISGSRMSYQSPKIKKHMEVLTESVEVNVIYRNTTL